MSMMTASDTVTVPRWALEIAFDLAKAHNYEWISAWRALERALDTKTEMPDEVKPQERWSPENPGFP